MENRFEIIVEVNGVNKYLDTYKYEPITLTYNIADIQDISKRNSSFSKTITLPETANNRDVFSNISDLSSDSTFNPNLKSKAWILVETISVFEGYLQLRAVNLSDSIENTYEVVIFADNDTFFTRVGEGFIADLDYSDLNHIYSTQSIINSWTSGQELGYFYPLIDYGQGWIWDMINGPGLPGTFSSIIDSSVNLDEMFPATYVKTIWDKIFLEHGYQYNSSFLNSQKFKDLLIPFNGTVFDNGPDFKLDKQFRAGFIPPQVMTASTLSGGLYLLETNLTPQDENSPNGDPNGLWDPTTGIYTNLSSDVYSQAFGFNMNVTMTGNTVKFLILKIYRQNNPDGTQNSTWVSGDGVLVNQQNILIQFGSIIEQIPNSNIISDNGLTLNMEFWYESPFLNNNNPNSLLRPLSQNESVRFKFEYYTGNLFGGSFPTVTINSGYIFNEVESKIYEGMIIFYKNIIPKKVKQKDFITSIIKMFNLYVEESKTSPNTLIIEPRDDYYASGVIKDWTDKIDLNVDIKTQILADIQNREVLFSYKEDKDYLNTYYKTTWNEVYGQELYTSENEFSKGTKKIDVIFSPTPIYQVPGSVNIAIPKITKDITYGYNQLPGGQIESNIRIVRRWNDGNNNGLVPFDNGIDYWFFEGVQYNSYPYVGHYDHPFTPTDDINWGQLLEEYYTTSLVTQNNLVNNYWLKFLNETYDKNSRIITVEMYLTPSDINNFRFNDSIYLFFNGTGHYYKVNKITGYDPGMVKTCTVELIKSFDIPLIKIKKTTSKKPISILQGFSGNVIVLQKNPNTTIGSGVVILGSQNTTKGISIINNGSVNDISTYEAIVNGNFNTILPETKSLIVNGDNNTIEPLSYNINISGDNNVVGTSSNNLQVFGSNNIIGEGVTNSVIIGYGVTATQSNQTYIGNDLNVTQINGVTFSNLYLWEAGPSLGVRLKSTDTISTPNVSNGIGSYTEGIGNVSSGRASHAEGEFNTALGNSSHVEGRDSQAIGFYSHAGGKDAISNNFGEFSRASGGVVGISQTGFFTLGARTTDNTPTILFLDSAGTEYYVLNDSSVYNFKILISAYDEILGDVSTWEATCCMKRVGNSTTLVGTPTITLIAQDAGWSATLDSIAADDTNESLEITVTGTFGSDISWGASVWYGAIYI